MSRRNCDELGVCKVLTPPCNGCTLRQPHRQPHPYAPGVIERHGRRHGKHLARWLVRALCLTALSAVAVGLIKGGAL